VIEPIYIFYLLSFIFYEELWELSGLLSIYKEILDKTANKHEESTLLTNKVSLSIEIGIAVVRNLLVLFIIDS
jgi:hypothetical protein